MKLLFSLLCLLGLKTAYSQNTFIYLKSGEKMTIMDWDFHHTWREALYYSEQKGNGKFASSKRMDITKIEKLEAPNNVKYFTHRLNEKSPLGFFKTLIESKTKRFMVCYRPIGSQRNLLSINYAVIDENNKEIVSGLFPEGDLDKQAEMFKIIKQHFSKCNEVLQSIEQFKNVRHDSSMFIEGDPVGFTFQNKVFICD